MHAQISLNHINIAPSAENYETLDQLVRIIDFAEGLTILFARCNVPTLRQTLATEAIRQLGATDITVVPIEWTEDKGTFLDYLRQTLSSLITTEERLAIFIYGLEQSMPSSDPYPPILAELNSARELFHRDAPYPIVFWLPDYALTTLARGALDFWAWRSGVFEFETEPIYRTQALHLYARQDADWLAINNMTAEQKRRRRHVLQNLLADYRALPQDKRILGEQAEILFTLGQLNQVLGDYAAAHQCYQQSLVISEQLDNQSRVVDILNRIGSLYLLEGKYEQAEAQFLLLLMAAQKIASQSIEILALNQIGSTYLLQEKKEKAKKSYNRLLAIAQQIGDQSIEAGALYQLGMVQFTMNKYPSAFTYYRESLELNQQIDNRIGIALNLMMLGRLSQAQRQYEKARTYYQQTKDIFQEIGSRLGIARTLALIGFLTQEQGNITQAVATLTQALTLFKELGTPEEETIQAILTSLQVQKGQEAFSKAWR